MIILLKFTLIACSILVAVGLKTYRKISSNTALAIFLTAVLFVCISTITVNIMKSEYSYDVYIELTGEKNEAAQGNDVGIVSIKIDNEYLNLSKLNAKQNWINYSNEVIWRYSNDNVFVFSVPVYAEAEITLRQNIWAGIIKISVLDKSKRIDLYSSNDDVYVFAIDAIPFSETLTIIWPMLVVLVIELILIIVITILLCIYLPKYIWRKDAEQQNIIRNALNTMKLKSEFFIRLSLLFFTLIMMLSFAGRQSLWTDDIATISFVAAGEDLTTTVSRILSDAGSNPPLFYIIAYIWIRIAPYGTFFLKLPSIFFSCLGMWCCGIAAKRICGNRAAIITMVFVGTSFFLVNYVAFTFRSYGLLFFLCSILVIAYHNRLLHPSQIKYHIYYGVILALLLYTHYFGLLVWGILGLFDLCLFLKGKIKLNCAVSYLVSMFSFIPYFLYAFNYISASVQSFWPEVPTLNSLFFTIQLIFNEQWFILLLFFVGFVTSILLFYKKDYYNIIKCEYISNLIVVLLSVWSIALMLFVYVYSRYIKTDGSHFVSRYFSSILAPALIVAAIGLERVLEIMCVGKGKDYLQIVSVCIILSCFITCGYKQLVTVNYFPGFMNQPIEQCIDWIYEQDYAHYDNTLVMMTGFQEGLYYYATHGLQRENLNFGFLTSESIEKYDVVFSSPMHGAFSDEVNNLLSKYYKEIDRNDSLNVVVYKKVGVD